MSSTLQCIMAAARLTFGPQFIIDNRAGRGGAIGAELVKRADIRIDTHG
jgi:hypothetical protein